MSDIPEDGCEVQRLSFDDDLWDNVTAITERLRGTAAVIAVNMAAAALTVAGVVLSGSLGDRPGRADPARSVAGSAAAQGHHLFQRRQAGIGMGRNLSGDAVLASGRHAVGE